MRDGSVWQSGGAGLAGVGRTRVWCAVKGLEMSFHKLRAAVSPQDAERRWFAGLLWQAFPEATSDDDLASLAADVLSSDGKPVTARAVRNWLRCENTPHFRYVISVISLAGAESVFQILDPERRR